MRTSCSVWKGMAAGLAGGLAASWSMNQFQELLSKAQNSSHDGTQESEQHSREEPATVKAAEQVSRSAFHHELADREKAPAGEAVHYTMGAVSGAVYGALANAVPATATGYGLSFGTALWILADEAAVPGLGLSKSPSETPKSSHLTAWMSHLVYGFTTDVIRRTIVRLF